MDLENDPVSLLIIAHAILGGVALLAGSLAMIFKKGSKSHKRSGKVFFLSMLAAALIAIVITVIPSHFSPFLLAIGIFSLYLLLSGYRALKFKKSAQNLFPDQLISASMLLAGILMIVLPLLMTSKLNIVLAVFGGIGLLSAIRDLLLYQHPEKLKSQWLRLHLGNMIGAYIASLTAFLVVNQFLPPLVGWLGPTVVGTFYILWWNRKLGRSKRRKV
ncbi:MAG: DUF2306 domain-containing protein [Flavobacteriales bacterium]|nr:DUF2306 domain-containing protein [Flavobacteriales bacterium]